MNRTCVKWWGIALLLLILCSTRTVGHAGDNKSCAHDCHHQTSTALMGTNLTRVADWSPEYPFGDAFKTSRGWITQDLENGIWDTREEALLDLDAQGWVKSLPASNGWQTFRSVGTLMFTEMGGRYPVGDYLVLYDGKGELRYGFDARKDETRSWPGRDVIHVTPSNEGIFLEIVQTDPQDYLRNIRVIMPGIDPSKLQTEPFHPAFLRSIEAYGALRFMDWQRTNWSLDREVMRSAEPESSLVHPLEHATHNPNLRYGAWHGFEGWDGRALPTDARYSGTEGVPLEIMVQLANTVEADTWFNVPHLANNSYVWNMAMLVLQTLDKERMVYIEYSNEVWNTAFGQSKYAEEQGRNVWQYQLYWHGKFS